MRESAVRRVFGVLGAMALAGAGLAVAAPSVGADTYDVPGTVGHFTVPAGVCQVTIAAWGGSGDDGTESAGGDSGRVQADFRVTAGDVLDVEVGARGSDGGGGYSAGGPGNGGGGHGGGSSAVTLNSLSLIIAGGGGGGGANDGGGDGGRAVAFPPDPGDGVDGGGASGGTGGSAQGSTGIGGSGSTGGGGGGGGAAPGLGGSANGGGGGGGNFVEGSLSTNLSDPGGLQGPGGEVRVNAAAPGVGCDPQLQVRKTVIGTSSRPFTIQVNCTRPIPAPPAEVDAQADETTVDHVNLPYLADGSPDQANAPQDWFVADHTWALSIEELADSTCTATETDNGGAVTVSYACAWTPPTTGDGLVSAGCPGVSAGPSAAPLSVHLEGDGDLGELTVTNSFPLDIAPAFTG